MSASISDASVPVLSSAVYGGMAVGAQDVNADYRSHYGDGMNVHAAYGGNPLSKSDALGLFFGSAMSGMDDWGGIAQGGYDPFSMVDEFIAEDAGSKAAYLERVIGGAHTAAWLGTYLGSWIPGGYGIAFGAANGALGVPSSLQGTTFLSVTQGVDAAVGLYSLGRLGHAVTSAAFRSGSHYYSKFGSLGAPGAKMFSGGVTGSIARLGEYATHLGKIQPYREARMLTQGANHAIEAHHLIEARHFRSGLVNGNVMDVPAIILTREEHMQVTAVLRNFMPYGKSPANLAVLRKAYEEAYALLGRSEWMSHIEYYFR